MIPPVSPAARAHVQSFARKARSVAPGTALSTVCELLAASPYRLLAVVADDRAPRSPLLGVVSERSIAQALLDAPPSEYDRLRRTGTAADMMMPAAPDDCATPTDSAADLSALLDRLGTDAAPVIAPSFPLPLYLGMAGRGDMVRDLLRPFVPPIVGGMATPLGVYLTDGAASGGVGTVALAATGLMTTALHAAGVFLLWGVAVGAQHYVPQLTLALARLPRPLAESLPATLTLLAQTGLFLAFLRQTPLAGYHAAEHMVVHAIERGEPLLPEVVRAMPRVHPRCSTNLVAGLLLFYFVGTALGGWLGTEASYLVGAFAAFLWWRPVGAFLQQHATTRPPSQREIESGIRAAKELFRASDLPISSAPRRRENAALRLARRIWGMGFVQILIGSAAGLAAFAGIALLFPALRGWIFEHLLQ